MTETMQYRDYIFRHNPATIKVSQGAGTAVHFCPGRGEVVQRLGGRCRTVECRGAFFGNSFQDTAAQMAGFRQRAEGAGPGTLFIPGAAPFLAYLRELTFEYEGDGRVLPYTMVFTEAEVGP